MKKVEFKKVEIDRLKLSVGVITFLKMFLRGVLNLSFVVDLYGVMNQKKIGERGAIELPSGDCVVAVKVAFDEAMIISAYNKRKAGENIEGRAETLLNNLFKLTLAEKKTKFSAKGISTVGKGVRYV